MFDLKTHVRDSKGKVIQQNHYVLRITEGVSRFERPPGSGYWFYADGKPCEETSAKIKADAAKLSAQQKESEAAAFKKLEEEKSKDEEIAALKQALAESHALIKDQSVAQGQKSVQGQASSVASEKEAPKKS